MMYISGILEGIIKLYPLCRIKMNVIYIEPVNFLTKTATKFINHMQYAFSIQSSWLFTIQESNCASRAGSWETS